MADVSIYSQSHIFRKEEKGIFFFIVFKILKMWKFRLLIPGKLRKQATTVVFSCMGIWGFKTLMFKLWKDKLVSFTVLEIL